MVSCYYYLVNFPSSVPGLHLPKKEAVIYDDLPYIWVSEISIY